MTAKEYLQQVRRLDAQIDQRIEQLEDLRDKAVGFSQPLSPDKVQTSSSGDKTAQIVERCVDLEAHIKDMTIALMDLKGKIIDQIHELDDYRYIELLYLRYIRYMRLEDISCTMKKRNGEPYSFDHIATLHGEALKSFSEKHKIP